jgi:AraC-like DNA-binding protein
MNNHLTHTSSFLIAFIAALTLCVTGCNTNNHHRLQSKLKDSIYTEQAAMAIYSTHPERALAIIDSAEARSNIDPFTASFLRARVLSKSYYDQRQDSAYVICKELLEHDSVKHSLNRQFNVLELLVEISRMRGDDEQCLQYATQLAGVCRQQGDEVSGLRTDAEVGAILTRLGQEREGLEKIDNVIAKLDKQLKFSALDASIIAMKRKINVLDETGRHAQVIPVAQRIIDKLNDYEKRAQLYNDGSYRQPQPSQVPDYCAFYRAQAYAFMACAHAITGNKQQARQCVNLFEQNEYSKSLNGRNMVVEAWYMLGDYSKVMDLYRDLQADSSPDTLNSDYARVLRCCAGTASALGDIDASKNFWHRYAHLNQQITDRLLACKAHYYAARYHTQEQQLQITHSRQQLRYLRLLIAAGIVLLGFALGFAIYFFRQRRIMAQKNKALTKQIAEANVYKTKYASAFEALPQPEPQSGTATAESDKTINLAATDDDTHIFDVLSKVILNEKLYLDPAFGRQSLMDRFGLSKEKVGAAFAKGSMHGSLTAFVNECRMDHAIKLLNERDDLSIKQIAEESGYYSANTFGRNFKAKYAISPTDYRNSKNA